MKILFVGNTQGRSPVRVYRGEGAMGRLSKLDPNIHITFPGKEPWIDLLSTDVVYFMRSQNVAAQALAQDALSMNIPVWYDIDDDLFDIPTDNPVYFSFDAARKQVVAWFLANSTVVTVSTKRLGERIKEVCPKVNRIEVVPNALDDYSLPDIAEYPGNEEANGRVVAWRGGATHQGDLLAFTGEYLKFLNDTEDKFKLHFMGYDPWYLRKGLPWTGLQKDFQSRIQVTEYQMDYFNYMGFLRYVVKPWALGVPLNDNSFNRCKSDIALLEAVYAGAVPVVPKWEEWTWAAASSYRNTEDFARTLMVGAGCGEDDKRRLWNLNVPVIMTTRVLSVVNRKRLEILKSLVGEGVAK